MLWRHINRSAAQTRERLEAQSGVNLTPGADADDMEEVVVSGEGNAICTRLAIVRR